MHYMTSTSINRTRDASEGYEALPVPNACESLYCQLSGKYAPYQYEIALPSIFRDNMEYSIASETLADNEEVYEDPGHRKEKIYAWFEKKKFRKIEINDIR